MSWMISTASAMRRSGRRPRRNSMHLTRKNVHVILDHVESRSRRRHAGDPVHSYHPAAARREG